ncbi:aspartate-proton symporter [mine drainage metagenome]|uniref:Aspartate-proton symporter n=1 Tax=mine drainage metagenome TaxID=410659 RepID=A0A1J5PJR1_9ZZZZ
MLAFVNAELTSSFPGMGAVITFPKLSHGHLAAAVVSWVVFLGYVTVAPAEVLAVVTYANNYLPGLVEPRTSLLTADGMAACVALLGVFILVNAWGVRALLRLGNTLMIWKLIIPVLTIAALMIASFHVDNFTSQGFAPFGAQGTISAIATSGIVFSYLGFRQAIELSGEATNPQRDVPIAIIGSVLIAGVIFVMLEVALIGAVNPADIAQGWDKLHFAGVSGPFAGLATILGMSWLAVLLYIDAVVSPTGTGLVYGGTTARVVYATGKDGLATPWFARINRNGAPSAGLWITWIVGIAFFLPFPSWQKIVTFISSATVLGYGIAPVALMTLRRSLPLSTYPRPYTLKGAGLWAPLAFIVSNLIIFWSGANTDNFLFGGLAVIFVLFVLYQAATHGGKLGHLQWKGAWWLLPYFFAMWLVTYLGPVNPVGGTGLLTFAQGMIVVVLISIAVMALAMASGLPEPEEAREMIALTGATRR